MVNKSPFPGLPPLDELLKRVNGGDSDKARYAALAKRVEDVAKTTETRCDSLDKTLGGQSDAGKKAFSALEQSLEEYRRSSQELEKKNKEESAQVRDTVTKLSAAIVRMSLDRGKNDKPNQCAAPQPVAEQLNATPVPQYSSELLGSLRKSNISTERVYNYLTKAGVYAATAAGRARFIADINNDASGNKLTGYVHNAYAGLSIEWKRFFIADLYKDLSPRETCEGLLCLGGLASVVLSLCCMIGSWCMSEPSKSQTLKNYMTYEEELQNYKDWKSGLARVMIVAGLAGVAGVVAGGKLYSNKNVELKSDYFNSFLKDAAK